MSEFEVPEDLRALEASLRGLAPASSLDERAVFFQAGAESVRRSQRRWQRAAAAAVLVAAGFAGVLVAGPQRERIVYVPATQPVQKAPGEAAPDKAPALPPGVQPPDAAPVARRQLAQGTYLELRARWESAEGGADWVPPPSPAGKSPRRADELN